MTTEESRSKERHKRIKHTAIAAAFAKAINALSGLVTVPVTLAYLGNEQFGIWMALTGFVAFLAFTDMGLGIGLQNALTRCHGKDDHETPAYLISSALFLFSLICAILCTFSIYVIPELDSSRLIQLSDNKNNLILLQTTQAIIIVFAISLPLGMIQRILDAHQNGLVTNILLSMGRVLSLASVFLCISYQLPLPIMAGLYMGMPFVLLGLGGVYIFWTNAIFRPSLFKIRRRYIRQIASTGSLALFAQIGSTLMNSGPLLLLTSQFGAVAVVPFAITQRLLSMPTLILSTVLAPLWPAYGEAYARGDAKWIKSTFKKSMLFTAMISVPIFIVLSFYGQLIIEFWSQNKDAVPSWELLMVCNIWALFLAIIRVFSMFLNGLNHFKGQAIYGLICPVLALVFGYYYSFSNTIVITLLIMIAIGEIVRSTLFGIESWLLMSKINKRLVS